MGMYGLTNMIPNKLHTRALPPHLADARGPIVRMFCHSLGYFLADLVKITGDIALRGKFPNLWQGRLIHHIVQIGANTPAILGQGKPAEQNCAQRSVLCMAYLAELSSVFLRLSNLLRARPHHVKLRLLVNWTLVVTFLGSRVVNFPLAIAMWFKARPLFPPALFKAMAAIQAGGFTLSAVWFFRIVQIALNTKRSIKA